MLDALGYPSDRVEACRDSCDALLAAWATNDVEDVTLESLVFAQAVVVLHAWFVDRAPEREGTGTNPLREVRVIADSVTGNDGILRVPESVTWAPERSVLRLAVGDEVVLTANRFERLAGAYLAALEVTYPDTGGATASTA